MSVRTSSIKEKSAGSDSEKGVNYGEGVVEPYVDDFEAHEVFKKNVDGVDFRTVGWPRASVIFLKSKRPLALF